MTRTEPRKANVLPIHKDESAALKRLYVSRTKLSQAAFGAEYDLGSQGNVWQYLNAHIPLNAQAARKFAKGLGVSVRDFSPRLADEIDGLTDDPTNKQLEYMAVWPFSSISYGDIKTLSRENLKILDERLALLFAGLSADDALDRTSADAPNKINVLEKIADTALRAANDNELIEIRKAAVKIVGGDPIVAIDHHGAQFDGVIYLAKSWLLARGLVRDKVFAAAVKGDSMEPRIKEGDMLLINQGDTTKRSGQVFGLSHDGKFMVKRLKKDGRHWCLMSDNPEHPPITAGEDTKVIGRVVLMKTENV